MYFIQSKTKKNANNNTVLNFIFNKVICFCTYLYFKNFYNVYELKKNSL